MIRRRRWPGQGHPRVGVDGNVAALQQLRLAGPAVHTHRGQADLERGARDLPPGQGDRTGNAEANDGFSYAEASYRASRDLPGAVKGTWPCTLRC